MLHRIATYALMIGVCFMFCVSCTDSDDASAMAANISSDSGGDLVLAGMAPIPGTEALPVDLAVETASVDLEFCKVDVKPNGDSAKTASGYCVNLFDDGGKMMAAFEIGETGSMALACSSKVTSYKPMLNFSGENINGEKLDRFMVYPRNMKPGDVYKPLLAIEYRQAPKATDTDAAHGGSLRVYPAAALAELADQAACDTRAAAKGAGGSLGIGGACASGGATSGGGGG